MRSPRAGLEEPYIRTRQDPYFDGLLRVDSASRNQASVFDFQGSPGCQNVTQFTSDTGDTGPKNRCLGIAEEVIDLPLDDSLSKISMEPFGHASSGSLSRIAKTTSFAFSCVKSDSSLELGDTNESKESSPHRIGGTEASQNSPVLIRPVIEKSYIVSRRKENLSRIPLPQSAASFYNGHSPQVEVVELCESTGRFNSYLKAGRDDVNAGVPGRFLHAIMGQDVSAVGSIASTIMYAFYLNETLKNDLLCTLPVINMKREDLNSHAELKWLLDSCQIDQSSLIFVDEVDLSYYDLFGSLKLVLLNGHELPTKQEALKEAVVEIFNCKKGKSVYSWVETLTEGQDCSCCSLVAEKFLLTSPEILVGQGFSRLLLAGILSDTANLTSPDCTSKDKYMATLLINGAGRFGCNGLYELLRYKMYDVSSLKLVDILRKDFRKWKRIGKPDGSGARLSVSQIGMSSIGVSVEELLAHEDTSAQQIKHFQKLEKIQLLIIVSGYYDPRKIFKREILVTAESMELMKNFLFFLNSNASQLPLKALHQPGLRDEMKIFEVDRVTSRKTIEWLLEEFAGTSKANNTGV